MPVSNISVVGVRFSTVGASRWIGQRSSTSIGSPSSIDVAEHVEDAAERDVADRHGDRAAGVDDLHPAGEAVGHVQRDRAHAVVAEVLLDLADEQSSPGCRRLLGLAALRSIVIALLISGSVVGERRPR